MWVVPSELEDAVLAATRAVLGDGPLAPARLHAAVIDRSERYTSDRDKLAKPADRVADLAARAAFFTIADAMKIAIPLGELRGRGALPARMLRVLDLGAGCGAMGLGLVACGVAIDYLGLDRDGEALRIAERAIRELAQARGVEAKVEVRSCDVTKEPLPPADLVLISTLLNELVVTSRLSLVQRALAAIGDDGAVIIIEPALRETSRELHLLRDTILTMGAAHVFAPCTRRTTPCPMLERESDWCHEERFVKLPPRTAEVSRVTHLRDAPLKFSYLVLRRAATPLVEAGGAAWRLVSAPVSPKGKTEILGCSDEGHKTIRLMKRHRNEQTKLLERVRRGHVLVIDTPSNAERLEVQSDTKLELVDASAATEKA
ncbi:hypothetical protein BH11MYX1_BH11MYX1_57230 [soil metagenome]